MIDLNKIEPTPTDEPLPEAIRNFLKNNPDKKHESLYLCESVDMDGNVIDTKIGVNLLTNYGLKDHFVDGNDRSTTMYIYLGSGQTAPDPASSSLTSYISALGRGEDHTKYFTYWPIEYDANTQILSTKMKITREYWDYTSGNNNEYEIWEIGVGHSQTTLRTHALIYDELGQQTCIVKRPNTRLYITVWWTASVSIAQIPDLYNEGKYCFVSPLMAMPYYGYRTMYWSMIAKGAQYTRNNDWWTSYSTYTSFSWNTHSDTNVVSGDACEVHYEKGPTSSNEKLWEDDIYYLDGWYISAGNAWSNSNQRELHTETYFAMTFYDELPEPEELETTWIYTNTSFQQIWSSDRTYTGNELNTWGLYRLDNNFGNAHNNWRGGGTNVSAYPPSNWGNPVGNLPCTKFNISELTLYNHLTKEWDIPVPFKNAPNRDTNDEYWRYFCYDFYTRYNGVAKHVYVFVNMFPHDANGVPIPHILGFSNSNMVIAATDEYWDTSTYVEIANLSSVPAELQQKRYYVVISGTNAVLSPIMTRADWDRPELVPTKPPYELTHDTTGVLPRLRYHRSYNNFTNSSAYQDIDQYGLGSKPLVHNEKGFFLIAYMLCFKNQDNTYTTYNLLLEDKYTGDKMRRYMTRNGDKIVIFGCYYTTDLSNSSSWTNVNKSYAYAANRFDIWTITDANTAPTRESLEFVWSDSTVSNKNSSYHLYSWSDLGYLVAAKRRTETEFIWVDVYAQGGAQMHLVTDAKHARVMGGTSVVVYQDINLSSGTDYVFKMYDMADDTTETLTINDGTTYTVQGIYGYNDHVYFRMKSSDNVVCVYYYNRDTGALEKLSWDPDFMQSDFYYGFWSDVIYDDYCFVFYSYNDFNQYVYKGNTRWSIFDTSRVHTSAYYHKLFPCLNEICGGKHLLLTTYANTNHTGEIVDIGLLLDSDPQNVSDVPYSYYKASDRPSSNFDATYVLIPFDDGIIRVCTTCQSVSSSYYTNMSGRMFWFPPEMCMRMHIKGTTNQLNSFNAPVRWSLTKSLQWNITNDLSRLLPENNNGG